MKNSLGNSRTRRLLKDAYLRHRQQAVELAKKRVNRPESDTEVLKIAHLALTRHVNELVDDAISRDDNPQKPMSSMQREALKNKFKEFFNEIEAEVSEMNHIHKQDYRSKMKKNER